MSTDFKLSCVLFDLDGTLVDTAPDLILCLNKALSSHGLTTVTADTIKPFISFGAVAMINESLDHSISEALRADILETMLRSLSKQYCRTHGFFQGMSDTLDALKRKD